MPGSNWGISYGWLLPLFYPDTDQAKARVELFDEGDNMVASDESDAVFSIHTLSNDTEPPTITSTVPMNSDINVSVKTNMTISFSEVMNKTSVEDAIRTYPMPGILSYTVSWEGDDTIILTQNPHLDYMQSYEVSVDTKAEDLVGNHLEEPYTFYFTTEEYPALGKG